METLSEWGLDNDFVVKKSIEAVFKNIHFPNRFRCFHANERCKRDQNIANKC